MIDRWGRGRGLEYCDPYTGILRKHMAKLQGICQESGLDSLWPRHYNIVRIPLSVVPSQTFILAQPGVFCRDRHRDFKHIRKESQFWTRWHIMPLIRLNSNAAGSLILGTFVIQKSIEEFFIASSINWSPVFVAAVFWCHILRRTPSFYFPILD